MHGYFLSLKLYETARVIANPFAYDEYREKMIKEKMEKMAESRIRTKKDPGVKVNKALAEKLLRAEERAKKKTARTQNIAKSDDIVGVDIGEDEEQRSRPKLLDDPRFTKIFEDPAFAIDENSKEFTMLNPSTAAQKGHSGEHMTLRLHDSDDTGSSSSDHVSNSENERTDLEDTSESSAEGITILFPIISQGLTIFSQRVLPAKDAFLRSGSQKSGHPTYRSYRCNHKQVYYRIAPIVLRSANAASLGPLPAGRKRIQAKLVIQMKSVGSPQLHQRERRKNFL